MGDSAGGHISGILATQMSQYLKAAVLVYPIVTFGILSRYYISLHSYYTSANLVLICHHNLS